MQDPGLTHLDDERYFCARCKCTFIDLQIARTLPVEMGDVGLPVHVGYCTMCRESLKGDEMHDLHRFISEQEAWAAVEDRIDGILKRISG